MTFTLVFGIVCSIILYLMNMGIISLLVLLATMVMLIYSFHLNYKVKKDKIQKREQRKQEERDILLNVIAEIVDFRYIMKDGTDIKNKITTMLKSLDYNNYIKTTNKRNINIKNKEKVSNNTDLFDEQKESNNKLNPPDWNLEPPYGNVRTVIR